MRVLKHFPKKIFSFIALSLSLSLSLHLVSSLALLSCLVFFVLSRLLLFRLVLSSFDFFCLVSPLPSFSVFFLCLSLSVSLGLSLSLWVKCVCVWIQKTPPCVHSKRPVYAGTTHVLNVHMERRFKIHTRVVVASSAHQEKLTESSQLALERFTKETGGSHTFSV